MNALKASICSKSPSNIKILVLGGRGSKTLECKKTATRRFCGVWGPVGCILQVGDGADSGGWRHLVSDRQVSLQHAVEAPTFCTNHFPTSFYPRKADPGSLLIESRIPRKIRGELARRGHRVRLSDPWGGGNTMAVKLDRKTGVIHAAASPRYEPAYAMGW